MKDHNLLARPQFGYIISGGFITCHDVMSDILLYVIFMILLFVCDHIIWELVSKYTIYIYYIASQGLHAHQVLLTDVHRLRRSIEKLNCESLYLSLNYLSPRNHHINSTPDLTLYISIDSEEESKKIMWAYIEGIFLSVPS